MRDPRRRGLVATNGYTADGYGDGSGGAEEGVDEDFLLRDLRRGNNDSSAGNTAVGAAVGTRGHGVRAVVVDELLDGGVRSDAVFVRGDVLGEEVAPVVVRVVVNVAVGVCGNARGADGADVVGFAIVIPGDDLGGELVFEWQVRGRGRGRGTNFDEFGLDFEYLVPAGGPEVVTA